MTDKFSESAWTGFTKKLKLKLDDGALLKALAKVDKTDDTKPEPRVAALEDTIEQVKKQVIALARRKKELGDKVFAEVKDKLDELLEQAEKLHKATLAAVAKARAGTKDDDDGDEEEDSPALLTSKMIPLLRQLRKGDVSMHALISTAGKNTAVLIMRKPVGVARRKILADAVDAKGGAKYIAAECLYQNKALTFVVKDKAAGLAKRLREALQAQTDLRLKVVVRGDDGEEQDGQEEADTNAAAQAAPGAAGQNTAPQVPQPPSAQQQAYAQRLHKVQEQLVQALQAKHPESTKLRAVIGFASEKAAADDIAGAGKALDMLEKLLSVPAGGAVSQPGGAAPAANRPVVATVVFQQARLAWEATRKKAQAELRSLQNAIVVDFKGEPDADEVDTLAGLIGTFLDKFDTRLSDKLDEALNAKAAPERLARQQEATLILAEYRGFVETDARLKLLDTNPFMPVTIRKGVLDTLTVLGNKLGA